MTPNKLTLTPLNHLHVQTHQIPAYKAIPNTSLQHKPLLIYRSAFSVSPPATTTSTSSWASPLESHLKSLAVVNPQWRYTMYSTTHFHSTTHEVLAIARGRARLCFGGEENPGRVETEVERGDVVVLPAGVGHRLLEDLSEGDGGFEMVGCYPPGYEWDMCYGRAGEEEKVQGIKALEWFARDPVYGDQGPVMEV